MLSFLLRRAARGADANEALSAIAGAAVAAKPEPEQVIAAFVQTLARLDPCGSAPSPRRRPRVVASARKG
ncbi:hypothetical protein GCM10007036_12750 [Alsobacter metallidurans]|uniref:Uncharacterized protein n=1 Tax=Alsobacter metallidurans TaxID=340221 RepID=A0A917I5P3_9HYPH|nr:hypothetical protein [Alsobacter metallidurans]GGH13864.1 hypothetical protein GCM10007036_12750 [Alsobacter metallidurans]